jgi:hypothetical protein
MRSCHSRGGACELLAVNFSPRFEPVDTELFGCPIAVGTPSRSWSYWRRRLARVATMAMELGARRRR